LTRQIPCYYLSLPDTWSAFKSGLSRNVKESLRKCYNSLKRDGHAFVFRAIDQPAHVDPALDRFFHLHTVRAQATGTIEHTDVFRTRKTRDFLRAYGQRMAERGRFVVFQLEIGGEVVATRVAMIFGDQLYLYYSGYNISWARYSVMTTLVAEAIQWAIDRRFKVVNLSTGSDVSKTRWSPHEVIFTEGLQRSSTPRGQLSFRVYHKVRAYSRRYLRLKKSLAVARRAE
jgi:CelD/BcsL family acetyltransferase involved in cellulose biosynthesis